MERHRSSAVGLFVAMLLLVPVVYVGSYLALVRPFAVMIPDRRTSGSYELRHYRYGGDWSEAVFWPLEQADRWIRPTAWREPIFH
jgi:hypothetical protein